MQKHLPGPKRFDRHVIAIAFALSMVLAFASPVVHATANVSSTAGQTSTVGFAHYQIGHEPVVSALPQGGSQSSKKVTVLAKNQDEPQPMTVSRGYVYWYDWGSSTLDRVSESGGKVQTLATTSQTYFGAGVAVEGNYVYWTHVSSGNVFSLYKTDISTGKTKTLYSTSRYSVGAGQLAVSGDKVYFAPQGIYRIDTNGSGLARLTDKTEDAIDTTYSNGVVYWLNVFGQVGSVPADGGKAKLLTPVLANASGWFIGINQLVVADGNLYWTFNGSPKATVNTVSTLGMGFKTLYSAYGNVLGGLTYSNGNVIFADNSTGAIYSVPHDGGKLRTVVDYPTVNLEAAGGTIYLVSLQDSTVGKTPV